MTAVAAAAVVALAGCDSDEPINKGEDEPAVQTPVADPKGDDYVPGKLPKISRETYQILDSGFRNFGLSVFGATVTNDDNMVISPLSLYMSLTALANGAEGNTLTEILDALGADTREDLVAFAGKRMKDFADKSYNDELIGSRLNVANAIWLSNRHQLFGSYAAECRKWLNADVFTSDLTLPAIVDEVNSWAKEQTNGLIHNIIYKPYPSQARLVVANALYYKVPWLAEWPEVKKLPFSNADGSKTDADMLIMPQKSKYGTHYYETADYEAVTVGLWSGNGTDVYLILPKVEGPIKSVDTDQLAAIVGARGESVRAEIYLPKFRVSSEHNHLSEVLGKLGIFDAFELGKADFGLISPFGIGVDDIKQNAVIDVNENGLEAAAVTITDWYVAVPSPGPAPEPREVVMHFDRPFIYVIYDDYTSAVMFAGVVNNL